MLGLIFILVGLGLFAAWIFLRNKAKAANQWPSTRGRIVACDVYRPPDTEAGSGSEDVRVAYDYVIAGATLRGNRISLGGSGSGTIKAKLARYQPGTEVDVFYNPFNPASAVLERKLPGAVLVLPIVGTCFFVVGVGALVIH